MFGGVGNEASNPDVYRFQLNKWNTAVKDKRP